jgi:CheY-like chemotaxis protein
MMRGDPDRLQQIVWNLLANAVKFTPPDGQVTVTVSQSAGTLTLTVADNGEGIPPEFLPLVFERFRQADTSATRRHGGLGIGLSLVRQLVELHGGRISVTSELGAGSVFRVTFPARPEFATEDFAVAESSTELAGLRILVVDDGVEGREMLTIALEQHGALVTAVASTSEALAMLDETSRLELPHAIVADVQDAGDAALALGPALGRRTTARGGAVPAVAVSIHDSPHVKRRVLAAGFHAHVVRPLSPSALAAVVRNLVRFD